MKIYQDRQDASSIIAKKNRLNELKQSIEQLTNIDNEAAQNGDFDRQFEILYSEMYALKDELEEIEKQQARLTKSSNTLNEVAVILEGLKNHPVEYDDQAVRQLISCIKVLSSDQIGIQFKDGTLMKATL